MIIDTNIPCLGKAQLLRTSNVETVGRYYRKATHPEWAITRDEAKQLSAANIQLFTVFEEYGYASDLVLSKQQGRKDGESALKQAGAIKQPEGSAIYFAAEGLPHGYGTDDLPQLKEYFSGIQAAMSGKFLVGVYGDGIVCKTLTEQGFCKFSWLAAASTSFEGTKPFLVSWQWSLAQLGPLDIDALGLSIDIDVANGDFGAFKVPLV